MRHGLLDFDVVHVAVEPADARVRRRRALERREEVVLGPLAEGLAVREAEEDLGPRHVARRILDGEEDVEEVAALGRLRELGGRRGDGGRVADHGAAREEGVGPAAHGGVRAPAVRAAGAAGDVAVVVEAVVARDAALEDARVQERLLGDDVVRPVPRRVEELQVLRVADGGEAAPRRRAEAPLDRRLLGALPVVQVVGRDLVLAGVLLERRHEVQGARLEAVDVDERREREVRGVGGDDGDEAQRPAAHEARERRRPVGLLAVRAVLVVALVPVIGQEGGHAEEEEHVDARLQAFRRAAAHG